MSLFDVEVFNKTFYVLVLQLVPVYPGRHLQLYLFTPSVHVPSFLHGLLEHSLWSETSILRNSDGGNVHIQINVYTHIHTHTHIYIYIYIYTYIYIYIYTVYIISIYIHIHINKYIYIYIYTYINVIAFEVIHIEM